MVAFAANSVLNRWALEGGHIDAASFTVVRGVSGAFALVLFLSLRDRSLPAMKALSGSWRSASALFVYMTFFSFAYLTLGAATGALILFAAVQITMFAVALVRGERFSPLGWAGLAAAFAGVVYLVLPGLSAPDPFGAVLMAIAGAAWGFYSLFGQGAKDPLKQSAANFTLTLPLLFIVGLVFLQDQYVTQAGVVLAVLSGAVTSGGGYVIWYAALAYLSAGRAATVQLSVPAIAALGGVLFLAEPISGRLMLASALTLGGVFLVLSQRAR